MTPDSIKRLLEQIAAGDLPIADGMEQLSRLPFSELPHSTLDTHRELRQGLPETIFGENKTPEQLVDILNRLGESHGRALATRFMSSRPSASVSPSRAFRRRLRQPSRRLGASGDPSQGPLSEDDEYTL